MNDILKYVLFTIGTFSFTVGDLVSIVLIFIGARILMWLIGKAYERRFAALGDDRGRKYAVITSYSIHYTKLYETCH